MEQKSRPVESNQFGISERLEKTVRKHLAKPFLRPIADHTKEAFDRVQQALSAHPRKLILDACCGVGDSSRQLAEQYTKHWVIGVDKSANRLERERSAANPENLILIRADLNDFYRLAADAGWQLDRHYILYPNPWPKAAHLGRRWHGAPVFPDLIKLGGRLELRSNWRTYLDEFQLALEIAGQSSVVQSFTPESCLTPFEQKYHQSQQQLWRLLAQF